MSGRSRCACSQSQGFRDIANNRYLISSVWLYLKLTPLTFYQRSVTNTFNSRAHIYALWWHSVIIFWVNILNSFFKRYTARPWPSNIKSWICFLSEYFCFSRNKFTFKKQKWNCLAVALVISELELTPLASPGARSNRLPVGIGARGGSGLL